MSKSKFNVTGMHCAACEATVEHTLEQIDQVAKAKASLAKGEVTLDTESDLDPVEFTHKANELLADTPYKLELADSQTESSNSSSMQWRNYGIGAAIAFVIGMIFLALQRTEIQGIILSNTQEGSLITPFIVGIAASLSSCMAVVGGVVLSLSSKYSQEKRTMPIVQFHIARLVSFFLLGGLLGLIGEKLSLSDTALSIINVIMFVMMALLALNLLGLGKYTQKYQLRLPKQSTKWMLSMKESTHWVIPIGLGIVTFILPCGFTQSMQVQAFSSGGFMSGASIMLAFALGTLPALALLSIASVNLSKHRYSDIFFKAAGFLILGFALFSLLSAMAIWGWIPSTSIFLGI